MRQLRHTLFIVLFGTVTLSTVPVRDAQAVIPILKIIKEAVKKVIKAVDLMIQRMQNETIALQNAAKVLENQLSKLKLAEIAEWTEKQRQLYQTYFDELWKIRNAIATYQRIKQILERQEQLVDTYKRSWQLMKNDPHFTKVEIDYMYGIYTGIFNESIKNLDQLLLVINSLKTQMTDGKRLEIIQTVGEKIEQNYSDLQRFNAENITLSLNRAKDTHEIEVTKKLYGLP